MEYEYFSLEVPVTLPKVITKFRYELSDLKPHVSVTYTVWCFSESGELVKLLGGLIDGDEYANWSRDDTYMDSLIKQKVVTQLGAIVSQSV